MMKYAYKIKDEVVVLDEKVSGAELASINDFQAAIESIENEILYKWKNGEPPLGFDDILGINLSDQFALKEDVYYWDTDMEAFQPIEKIQTFDNHYSWTAEEKDEFMEILLMWIATEDHRFDLYSFIRDINEIEDDTVAMAKDKFTVKFQRLMEKEFVSEEILGHFEFHYKKRKEKYQQHLEYENNKELLSAKVEGGIN